jgi:hypothetical protein
MSIQYPHFSFALDIGLLEMAYAQIGESYCGIGEDWWTKGESGDGCNMYQSQVCHNYRACHRLD